MTALRTMRIDAEDGSGSLFLDVTDAQTADQIRLEVHARGTQKSGGTAIALLTCKEARQLARALYEACIERSSVKLTPLAAPRARPEPNLKRSELTDESRRFPYVTWVPRED